MGCHIVVRRKVEQKYQQIQKFINEYIEKIFAYHQVTVIHELGHTAEFIIHQFSCHVFFSLNNFDSLVSCEQDFNKSLKNIFKNIIVEWVSRSKK